jgi:EmrB/QacA subfamily drug resistance transporter
MDLIINHKRKVAPVILGPMNREQRLVIIVSILGSLVAFLDGSIVNVALPAIRHSLGGNLSSQQWIVDAYALTLGAFILTAGSLSDLLGRKRILVLGLIGFGVTSLACAVAPNILLLIIFRGLQGIAGALLVPSSLAIIIAAFKGPLQGKAIGTWTAWTGISFIIGPLLGGWLVDQASWRWIFAINILPIAITLYLLTKIKLIKPAKFNHSNFDYLGTLFCVLGLGGPVFALIEQPRYGWHDPLIYLSLIIGLALMVTFLVHEKRSSQAMLPLQLFTNRNFSVGNLATLLVYAGLGASTFVIVLFLQQVSGYSAFRAGLAMLPVTFIMFLLSPRFGNLSARLGPRLFMGLGPIIGAGGFLLLARLGASFNYWTQFLPAILIFGLGLSITVSPLTAAILSDVGENQAGIASAVNNAVSRIASLVAVAAVGAVISTQFNSGLELRLHNFPSQVITKAEQSPLVIAPPKSYQHSSYFRESLTVASVKAFHGALDSLSLAMALGGLVSLIGIRNKPQLSPVSAD